MNKLRRHFCKPDRVATGRIVMFGVFALGLLMFSFSTAAAQNVRFGRVASAPFSGRVNFDDRRKGAPTGLWINLGSTVQFTWGQLRPVLAEQGRAFLNERDIGGGFRTSRSVITLAQNGSMYFGVDGTGFTVKYVLRGNRLDTSLRVPGPSPSGIDPRVYVMCDLEVTIDVELSGTNLLASPARLKPTCGRPVGLNLTAQAAIGVDNLIRFLGGPDFIGMWLQPINRSNVALSPAINVKFSSLLPKRTQYTSIGFSRRNDQLDLIFEDDNQGPKVH